MSHNTIIKDMKVANLDALKTAVNELAKEGLNIGYNESGTFRTWQGQPNKADFTVTLPGERFDVGFIKDKETGNYLPIFDHMLDSNKVIACDWRPNAQGGDAIGRLMQRYGVCAAEYQLAMDGYACQRVVNAEDKSIKVIAEY